ncbi:MAG: glycosyltransferase [Promethearchaeota archaeon]
MNLKMPILSTLSKLTLILIFALFFYYIFYYSSSLVILIIEFWNWSRPTILFNLIYLLIEIVISFYTIYLIHTLYHALNYERKRGGAKKKAIIKNKSLFVSIIMPIKDIDPELVELSLKSLLNQSFPSNQYEIILSTNSGDQYYLESYRALSYKYNTKLVERNSQLVGFKAGVLNDALKVVKGKYFIVHDADHLPKSNFIESLVMSFETLPSKIADKTAYIQARSTFTCDKAIFQKLTSLLRAQVFEVYYRAKNRWKTTLFNGFTACFQTKIMKELQGFPIDTLTENNGVSIKVLTKGYYGLFNSDLLSIGDTPKTFRSQVAQLWRWNNGTASLLRLYTKPILTSPNLSKIQKYDLFCYLLSPLILIFVCILVPAFFLGSFFLNLPILRPEILIWGSLFLTIPGLFVSTELALTLTAIGFEESNYSKLTRLYHLVVFYLLSLTIPFFIVSASIKAFIRPQSALKPNTQWNRRINLGYPLMLLLILIISNLIALIKSFTYNNDYLIIFGSFFGIYILGAIIILISMKNTTHRPNSIGEIHE